MQPFIVRPRNVLFYVIIVFVPMVYILLLPAFAYANPFGTGTFAGSLTDENSSISQYLSSAPANGGFAAFTSPVIAYAWLNPITQSSIYVQFSTALLTLGWLLSILMPIGFASSQAHQVAFIIGVVGVILFSFTLLLQVRFSWILTCTFVFLFVSNIITGCILDTGIAFLVFEMISALFAIAIAPAVNVIGKRKTDDSNDALPRKRVSKQSRKSIRARTITS